MSEIYRIWEGQKECSNKPYYVVQVLITSGRLEGTFKTISHQYPDLGIAELTLTLIKETRGER